MKELEEKKKLAQKEVDEFKARLQAAEKLPEEFGNLCNFIQKHMRINFVGELRLG
ncbi:MAG: hypothetical protein P4L67_02195 [Candidatus Pacebacteria bacterium]|nr:hypothetical protein [Candidatus Paceibacterota bacterium]